MHTAVHKFKWWIILFIHLLYRETDFLEPLFLSFLEYITRMPIFFSTFVSFFFFIIHVTQCIVCAVRSWSTMKHDTCAKMRKNEMPMKNCSLGWMIFFLLCRLNVDSFVIPHIWYDCCNLHTRVLPSGIIYMLASYVYSLLSYCYCCCCLTFFGLIPHTVPLSSSSSSL